VKLLLRTKCGCAQMVTKKVVPEVIRLPLTQFSATAAGERVFAYTGMLNAEVAEYREQ